ncbi:MAG: outer membrane beta-barrel protein [Elusimicrobia bacterium]|nr:outer membrane beta-barrel protein [Elusimicrobiota bacterium]
MKNKILFAAAALLSVSGAVSAGENRSLLEGLSITGGLTHVAESDSRIDGVHNREGNEGSIQTQDFDPVKHLGYSLGAEYLWPAGGGFVLGPGVEYNSPGTLQRIYGNNMLKRRISAQEEVYKDLSNIPVYFTLGYHFKTASSAKPFIFGRWGYSFNRMGSYSMTLYEEGPMPLTGPPVEAAGDNVTRTSDVRDLAASPYYGIGMGLRFKDRYFIQALYSYTSMRFRAFYPTSYTYYNVPQAATVNESFQVIETHQLNYSRVQFNLGYSFGPLENSDSAAGGGERERNWRNGFNLKIGLNKNLPMTSQLTHINATVINQYGQVARSVQNVVSRPVEDLSGSVSLEYLHPVFRRFDVGIGVMHNLKHTYEKVQTTATGGYTQIRIEDFTNTVPYAALRYCFKPDSDLEPYLVGRIGYSYNKFKYNKYNNEAVMAGVSAADIKNGLYTALGIGSRLSRHVFGELVYDVTKSGHTKPPYNGDSEEFKTKLQSIHFDLGYNF